MSEAINSRPGPWLSEGNWTYTLRHAGWRHGQEQFENRLFAQVQPGRNSSLAEANPIASLFAEAGNVFHETGLTPRQLVEQRDALAKALEDVAASLSWLAYGEVKTFHDRRIMNPAEATGAARAALALVKGAIP
ncbi:hypothetical protein [Delftia sp. PE138]|uniref:hypothetical protein n=1 Tax=Delftia sp. PE138 TaxID=1812483 RepID=UPI001BB012EA|nr:hypothetical protein [Delftia sp. PE138]MBS3723435.1 hypothetical protein [Delftia sp. PE138]